MVGVAYAMVKVPSVNADVQKQGATVYYRDNTPMMKIGTARTIVKLSAISPSMQNAALAAEDHNFYHESAISPTGIARAVFNNLSGGDTQGGSTITQQYVKNAYLNQQRTFTRKFKELFISVKVGKQESKDQILENYLNTIYFGRSSYGIEAAAQAYFGVHAAQLTVPQSAILAGTIKYPGHYDPANPQTPKAETLTRYQEVLKAMVSMGKVSQTDYQKWAYQLPKTKKLVSGDALKGQKGFLYMRVKNALKGMGYTDQQIETGGLKVYTTWDKNLQAKAQKTVQADLKAKNMPANTRVGLVTLDPTKGEVLAAYGGKDFIKREVDDAYQATAQVGSSFKPYVLAAALQQGIGLKSKFDASAPQWFDTKGDKVAPHTPGSAQFTNDEGNTNQVVDLVHATAESYNTVYVPLGFKAGSQNVFDLAEKAGLPGDRMKTQLGQGGFFLGQTDMRPLDQASGYATIANDGQYITPHSIIKVVEPGNKTVKPKLEHRTAFSPEVAHDVQYAMQAVVKSGTGVRAQISGHQVAGKTGTTNDNAAAWFSGFTPKQMVTTIGMWRFDDAVTEGKHKHAARYVNLQNVGDYSKINGGDLPAQIWHDYMTEALNGKPATDFAPPDYVGDPKIYATPKPTPTPTPTETPVCQPGQNPVFDHCKPDQGGGSKLCDRHPELPQCTQQSPPPTQPNCPNPLTCPTQTPPNHGGGGGGGGGKDEQQQAARPIDD
jgi:membrane peptidoglycan carboxypeptidase